MLVSIAITPGALSLAKGTSVDFTATGTYSDDSRADITSTVTWTSTKTNIASVSTGGGTRGRRCFVLLSLRPPNWCLAPRAGAKGA